VRRRHGILTSTGFVFVGVERLMIPHPEHASCTAPFCRRADFKSCFCEACEGSTLSTAPEPERAVEAALR
jgi:hypothetical protein